MLTKTAIIGLSLCATLGLVALANVAAPAADADEAPMTNTTAPSTSGAMPTCMAIIQHAHVEGPVCSSHFAYHKKTAAGGAPGPCGCPGDGAGHGSTAVHDNDLVDAKHLVNVGDIDMHDLVDVKHNDVDILEDIVENSDVDILEDIVEEGDVEIVKGNAVAVGTLVGGILG